jgi:hypothetical protein
MLQPWALTSPPTSYNSSPSVYASNALANILYPYYYDPTSGAAGLGDATVGPYQPLANTSGLDRWLPALPATKEGWEQLLVFAGILFLVILYLSTYIVKHA